MSDEPDLGFDYSNIEQKDTLKNYQNSKTKVSDQKTMINSFANYTNQGSVIGLKSYQNIPRKIMKKGKLVLLVYNKKIKFNFKVFLLLFYILIQLKYRNKRRSKGIYAKYC